ncbi:MAG: TlpA family protein disulfide reductase [Acidobacteria bacterium]|nr:TlpA family protein disulfide reductase [Acidobacteriota bacterium]
MKRLLTGIWLALLLTAAVCAQEEALPVVTETTAVTDLRVVMGDAGAGKPLLVNFWATWCGPCRVEFPELVRIDGDYRARGLRTALVSLDNRGAMESIVADFLQSYASTMPSYLLDLPKGRGLARAVRRIAPSARAGIPLTLLFDARGRLVYQKSGVLDAKILRAKLDRLLTVKTAPAVVK